MMNFTLGLAAIMIIAYFILSYKVLFNNYKHKLLYSLFLPISLSIVILGYMISPSNIGSILFRVLFVLMFTLGELYTFTLIYKITGIKQQSANFVTSLTYIGIVVANVGYCMLNA